MELQPLAPVLQGPAFPITHHFGVYPQSRHHKGLGIQSRSFPRPRVLLLAPLLADHSFNNALAPGSREALLAFQAR